MRNNDTSPRRRRDDEAADHLDSYVQYVIARLDSVILRLIEDADVLRKLQTDADIASPSEEPPLVIR